MNEKEGFLLVVVGVMAPNQELYLLLSHKVEDVRFGHIQLEEIVEERSNQ